MRAVIALVFACILNAAPAAAQIVLRDAGPGEPGRILAQVLARPHTVLYSRDPILLPRDSTVTQTVVIVAPRVMVAAKVMGDVVVIGGDLFMHPGGDVEGRAIAIGGGSYASTLAKVKGGQFSYRDATYDAETDAGAIRLSYRSLRVEGTQSVFTWPLKIGLRFPSYNRVDGVVLPWGPIVSLGEGRFIINPTVTYRSHLGNWDPGVDVGANFGKVSVSLDGRRGTFSNDKWIRGDLMNSLSTLVFGTDTRNYYRADRYEGKAGYNLYWGDLVVAPFLGGLMESRSWSTGTQIGPDSHVWSAFGNDEDGTERPNPAITGGRITSLLVGGRIEWTSGDFTSRLDVRTERTLGDAGRVQSTGIATVDGDGFTQTTLDGKAGFPTFGSQRLDLKSHAVLSSGMVPSQRFAYLGGSGTLPTMELLEMGGTELFFLDAAYLIPIERFKFKFVGSPQVTLRFITGSAGVGDLPPLVQNVGVRVGFPLLGVEYLIDPDSRKTKITVGFSGLR